VMGLSGNSLIHTLPPRLIDRVMAIRAASICRSVIHPQDNAFRPDSPKEISEPRQAFPHMRPRCCFLYLTFFGINITNQLFSGSPSLALGLGWVSGSLFTSCFQAGVGGASAGAIGPVDFAGCGNSPGG